MGFSLSYLSSFVWINLIFGFFVLLSYILGILQFPEYREALWGGVHGALRQKFIISMLIAAVGYLLFFSYIVYFYLINGDCLKQLHFLNILNFSQALNFSVLIFLAFAAIWMPTLIIYLQSSNSIFLYISNVSLWITAFASILIVLTTTFGFLNLNYNIKDSFFSYLTLAGLIQVVFHCLVIDGIIFVMKFPK